MTTQLDERPVFTDETADSSDGRLHEGDTKSKYAEKARTVAAYHPTTGIHRLPLAEPPLQTAADSKRKEAPCSHQPLGTIH